VADVPSGLSLTPSHETKKKKLHSIKLEITGILQMMMMMMMMIGLLAWKETVVFRSS
jgi:hypothetical protein